MGYQEEKQRQLDMRYLRMASIWAENSYCVRRKVGALIVKDKMIISDGYNGTPSGFEKRLRGRRGPHQALRAPRRGQRHHQGRQVGQQLRRLDALYHRRTLHRMFEADHPGRNPAGGLLGRLPFGRGPGPAAPRGHRVRTVSVMKRIVIAGATSGIGLEVAQLCIRAGWRVGGGGTPSGSPRSAPRRSPRAGRDPNHRHHPRRRSRTPRTVDRTAGRHGHLFPRIGDRQPQHRAAARHRTEHPAHQRRRLRQDGHGRLRLFPQPRRRTDRRHQLDRRHEGARVGPRPTRRPNGCRTPTSTHWRNSPEWKVTASALRTSARDSSQRRCSPATAATRC